VSRKRDAAALIARHDGAAGVTAVDFRRQSLMSSWQHHCCFLTRSDSMRGTLPWLWSALLASALAVQPAGAAQRVRDAQSSGGSGTTPPPASGGGTVSGRSADGGGAQSSGGSNGGARVVPRGSSDGGAPSGGTARPRGDDATTGTAAGRARPADSSSDSSTDTTNPRRPRTRDGNPSTGDRVERRPAGDPRSTPIYLGGYYPWGWSGFGFGYYDPWYAGYPDPGLSQSYSYGYEGALRLKVKPRDASVYVDGYYAGVVDQFDGVFQRLHLDSGPHRIELRLDGYQPLDFDVRIEPDQTTTYTGDLRKIEAP
jgi:hypothetical protein